MGKKKREKKARKALMKKVNKCLYLITNLSFRLISLLITDDNLESFSNLGLVFFV